MCLYTKQSEGFITKENIVCYKIMFKKFFGAFARFRKFRYWKHIKYKTNIDLIKLSRINCIESGFHSYQKLETAKRLCFKDNILYIYGLCVYECIIPKGSIVFKGDDIYEHTYGDKFASVDDSMQYVSNQIIVKRRIV